MRSTHYTATKDKREEGQVAINTGQLFYVPLNIINHYAYKKFIVKAQRKLQNTSER